MTDAIIFSLSRALTILPFHKMPLGLQKSEFLYLFEEKLTSMYIFYLWEYTQWVVSLELSGECVWKGFYFLSYLLSFFLLLLSFLLAPTGALVLMMVYYIYIYISIYPATFSDFEHLCLSILLQVSL